VDDDLALAIQQALQATSSAAAAFGARFSWERATDQFLSGILAAADAMPLAEPA